MYIMEKNKEISWFNREGDEDEIKDEELNQEKLKQQIKKRIQKMKDNKEERSTHTEETLSSMLNYLNELQATEKDLYALLVDENDSTNKTDIVNQINSLTIKRDKLYLQMKQLSRDANNENMNSSIEYENQLRIVKIAERELNREKERLKILNAEKFNKLRMVQINTYYSRKYEALGYVTILAIFLFILAIIINLLTSRGIIPSGVTNTVGPILIGIGIFILFLAYFDILKRSNFNFDEYNYPKEESSGGDGEISIWPEPNLGTCVGERCCSEGTEYDQTTDTCMVPSEIAKTNEEEENTEGFKTVKTVKPYATKESFQMI